VRVGAERELRRAGLAVRAAVGSRTNSRVLTYGGANTRNQRRVRRRCGSPAPRPARAERQGAFFTTSAPGPPARLSPVRPTVSAGRPRQLGAPAADERVGATESAGR
jgi:hypothetical protein